MKMTLKDFNKVNVSNITTYTVFDKLGYYIETFTVDLAANTNLNKMIKYIRREAQVIRVAPHPFTLEIIEVYLEV